MMSGGHCDVWGSLRCLGVIAMSGGHCDVLRSLGVRRSL